jgi:ferritin-like metal-binding protein YciE
MDTLEDLQHDLLKDLWSAENQLVKALPRMAKKANSDSLEEAILAHLEETKIHVERLAEIGELLEIKLGGKKCKAMEGLLEEGKEVLEADGEPMVIDAAIIAAAQRVEHYEISAYGTARAIAQHLGRSDVVELLNLTLEEESAADEKLTSISLHEILPAMTADNDAESEEEQDEEGDQEDEETDATTATRKRRR